jgi:hypothetical protein
MYKPLRPDYRLEPEAFPVRYCPKCSEEAHTLGMFKVSCEYCEETFDSSPYLKEIEDFEIRGSYDY